MTRSDASSGRGSARVTTGRAARGAGALVWLLALLLAPGCARDDAPEAPAAAGELEALARCLTERGVVYYGAAGCSACRAQERAFGAAFARVTQVECHPHAPGSQAERCVARGIRVTPSWLLEREGRELSRLEGARSPQELATFAGCPEASAAGSR